MSLPSGSRGRRARIAAVAAVVLTLIGGGIYAWHRGAAARALALAEIRFVAGDLRGAYLAAHQAHALRPNDPEALRLLADVAARAGSHDELLWRQRLCDVQPVSPPEDWIALAETALKADNPAIAGDALGRVPEGPGRSPQWYRNAAATAVAENAPLLAASILESGARVFPDEIPLQINLAAARIASGSAAEAAEAKAVLSRYENDSAHALEARRNLLALAAKFGDREEALRLARALRETPGASWRDRFRLLEILGGAAPEFEAELSSILAASASEPASAYAAIAWMNSRGLAERSAAWAATLDRSVSSALPAAMGWSEALLALGRWQELDRILAREPWGALEPLRRAYRARAAARDFDRKNYPRSADEWAAAIREAQGDPAMLGILALQAETWGWEREAADAWSTVAWLPKPPAHALKHLYRLTRKNGSTADLYRVVRQIASLQPDHPVAQNNLAALGLLLGRDVADASRIASDLHRRFPDVGPFACTRALAILIEGHPAEARSILESLDAETLAHPSAALYLALARARTGDFGTAESALEKAASDPTLLPEERALAARALAEGGPSRNLNPFVTRTSPRRNNPAR